MRRILTAVLAAAMLAGILPVEAFATGTPQSITFDLATLPAVTYGDAPVVVSSYASASSALPVSFTSQTPSVCTTGGANGSTVTILGAGDCTLQADQAGDTTYDPAAPVQQTVTIQRANQTVTAVDRAITFGDADPLFSATYGPWQYSDAESVLTTTPTCGVSGPHTEVAGSPYAISCSGAVAANYAFTYVAGALTIAKATAGISISAPSASFDGSAHGATGFAYGVGGQGDVLTPGVTIEYTGVGPTSYGPSVTAPSGGGTYQATASFIGNGDYLPATNGAQYSIGATAQTITFDLTTLPAVTYGDAALDVSPYASASSALPVSFGSQTPSVCTTGGTNGATVTILAAGSCTIRASQAGDANIAAATPVDQTFSIAKAVQSIVFATQAPASPMVGDTYIPAATSSSGLAVTLSIDPASSAICSMTAGTVTFNAAGGCVIDAGQAGDGNWKAATAQQRVGVQDTPPACPDASAAVVMDVAQTGTAGCTDLEHDPLTYAIVSDGAHGTATIGATGQWTYTPALHFAGADSFTFKANDGSADSAAATISLTVTSHFDPRNDGVTVLAVRPAVVDVLANDRGGTSQPLTITAVTQGARGRVTSNGTTVTYDPTGCSVGTDSFTYTVTDGLVSATKSVFLMIAKPGQNGVPVTPVTDTPAVGFVSGSVIGTTVPVRVSWCGVVAGALRGYNVVQSTNGGSSWTSTLYSTTFPTTRTSIITSLGVGTRYAWGVRTIDGSRRISTGYAASPASRIGRIEDSSTSIVRYSGSWGSARSSGYSGGTERWATRQSATATVVVSNVRAFAIVSSRAGTRGSFRVYVDGAQVAVVSERSSSTLYRRVVYVRSLTPGVRHTIAIRPYGTGLITLDAILTLE